MTKKRQLHDRVDGDDARVVLQLHDSRQHRRDFATPILLVAGEKAHSLYHSEDVDRIASEPKELFIVPGAGHVDLYDRVNVIPWDKLTSFFSRSLASGAELTGRTR